MPKIALANESPLLYGTNLKFLRGLFEALLVA